MQKTKFQLRPDVAVVVFLIVANLIVVAPFLHTPLFYDFWNNDYNYIGDALMLRDHAFTWNPVEYCGAPSRYVYPPLFHFLAILLPVRSMGTAIHIMGAITYAVTPGALYLCALFLFGSRMGAVFAAMAYSFLPAPIYLFTAWRAVAAPFRYAPWPFVALSGYRESPHMLAIALLLVAVTAAWRGRWVLATICMALVFVLSWPGIVALPVVMAAAALAMREFKRVYAAIAIAYGLVAFWMTPGYFATITLLDRVAMRHIIVGATLSTVWKIGLLLAGAVCLVATLWLPRPATFVAATLILFGIVVLPFTLEDVSLLPASNRYISEFNIGLLLAAAWIISVAGKWGPPVSALVLIAGGWLAFPFLSHPWSFSPPAARGDELTPTLARWLSQNAGSSRIFSAGELEVSLNAFTPVAQVGGNGQNVSNFRIVAVKDELSGGCEADPERRAKIAQLWLEVLGAGYVVAHDAQSRETLHWYAGADRFSGLPVAWSNGAGDVIYRVPGADLNQAAIVDLTQLTQIPPMRATNDLAFLEAYARWARGVRTVPIRWLRGDRAEIDGSLAANEGILVKTNYDPGWRASGRSVEADPIGFVLIRGTRSVRVELKYGTPWDVRVGWAITIGTIALLLLRVRPEIVAAAILLVAAVSYFAAERNMRTQGLVAEEAFIRNRSPIINPGGIVGAGPEAPALVRGKPFTIYALNAGTANDDVRVWVGATQADVISRGPAMVSAVLPTEAKSGDAVSVEVNGCRGNAFSITVK